MDNVIACDLPSIRRWKLSYVSVWALALLLAAAALIFGFQTGSARIFLPLTIGTGISAAGVFAFGFYRLRAHKEYLALCAATLAEGARNEAAVAGVSGPDKGYYSIRYADADGEKATPYVFTKQDADRICGDGILKMMALPDGLAVYVRV